MDIANTSLTLLTPNSVEGFLAKYPAQANDFAIQLLKSDISAFVANLQTKPIVLVTHSLSILSTVNEKEYENTHICSPYSIYVIFPKLYAKQLSTQWKLVVLSYATLFGKAFQWMKINKVIQLNNTLSTINLHPLELHKFIPSFITTLIKKYPNHAIMLNRFNQLLDPELFSSLENNNFIFIPTKTVHIFNPTKDYYNKKNTKYDLTLLKRTNYSIVYHDQITENDLERIHELYKMLFLEKHTEHNPDLTLLYFKQCHEQHWFEFMAFRNQSGIIDAFISDACRDNVMICGPLGYDTKKPRKLGLFRMIIALSLQKAHHSKSYYNIGSGNEEFKLNRGSQREIEYNAIYCKHLPFYRRLPWLILAWCARRFSLRIFEKQLI